MLTVEPAATANYKSCFQPRGLFCKRVPPSSPQRQPTTFVFNQGAILKNAPKSTHRDSQQNLLSTRGAISSNARHRTHSDSQQHASWLKSCVAGCRYGLDRGVVFKQSLGEKHLLLAIADGSTGEAHFSKQPPGGKHVLLAVPVGPTGAHISKQHPG